MKIKEICWYPIRPTEKGLTGFASLLYGKLSLNSIAVYTKPDGSYRLLFPTKRLANGKDISSYYPIDNETYESIKKAIVNKIEAVTKGENDEKKDRETKEKKEYLAKKESIGYTIKAYREILNKIKGN